jgi:hypothetical protein
MSAMFMIDVKYAARLRGFATNGANASLIREYNIVFFECESIDLLHPCPSGFPLLATSGGPLLLTTGEDLLAATDTQIIRQS